MKPTHGQTNLSPLAQIAVAFAAGTLLAQVSPPLVLTISAALLANLAALTLVITSRSRTAATVLLFAAFAFSGAALTLLEMRRPSAERVKRILEDGIFDTNAPVELTGILERNPEVGWDGLYLTLRVERLAVEGCDRTASGVVKLNSRISDLDQDVHHLQLRYGARIRLMTRLERTSSFRNPGVSPFTEYLDHKGYDASGFIKSVRLIERLDDDRVFLPLAWLYDWRQHLQDQFDSKFATETASVLDAALLGNRHKLRAPTEERFRDGGTFHVLVISGLHITFLGGIVFVVSRRLTRNRITQFVTSVAVVWAYSVAVGAETSVLRAALMFSVAMLAPLVSRRASALNGLGAVAIALLIWRPSNLLDPSFQLTFVSVLAILLLAWPILAKLSAVGSWRPNRENPYPPSCGEWLRTWAEILFWSEREGNRELRQATYSCKLHKSPTAAKVERLHLQTLLRFVFAAVVVSISVQLALLPFMVIYFHRLSLAAVLLNIFVSVAMAGLAFAAVAAVAVGQLSSIASEPLIGITNSMNWLMVHSVDPFAAGRVASIRLPEYTGWPASIYALYYVPLITLSICLSKWKPLELPPSDVLRTRRHRVFWIAICAQLLVIAMIVLHPLSAVKNAGKLRVDFLDVGQGDSALITLPDGSTILVDGGGRPGPFSAGRGIEEAPEYSQNETRGVGESVVSEYLWWRGLKRIDYLIATHADADHIDGLNDIVRNFEVRAALVARITNTDAEFAKLTQTLSSYNVPVRVIGLGDELQLGGVSMNVLWPTPSADSRMPSRNNDSIVLRLNFGKRTILLTGDVESGAEKALVARYQNLLRADVTKVAHHGSRSSSTENFVGLVKSSVAVISVGESSVFGHPHSEVVQRWEASGARVLPTGKKGMITLITDGHELQVTTFVNP